MTIQIPNPGTGNGATGDNEFVLWSKVKDNFSNTTHAASRLVGTAAGNVMEVGAFGLGSATRPITGHIANLSADLAGKSQFVHFSGDPSVGWGAGVMFAAPNDKSGALLLGALENKLFFQILHGVSKAPSERTATSGVVLVLGMTATKDANGFLKGASPVIDMYDNKIDLNHDATEQGGITFEKLGTGDYLVKGSLGFAQEGWYIETPKDANGNVLVAVVYEQLANNDISIKTYAKRFDDETGDIVPNLLKPRDIPTGRFISLRLHELPKEPPVMPTESQPEV